MFLLFDPVNPLLITQRVVNKDATLYIKWKEGRKEENYSTVEEWLLIMVHHYNQLLCSPFEMRLFNILNGIETFSQNNLKEKAEHRIVLHYDLKYVNIPYI